jgi:hypothetical protein
MATASATPHAIALCGAAPNSHHQPPVIGALPVSPTRLTSLLLVRYCQQRAILCQGCVEHMVEHLVEHLSDHMVEQIGYSLQVVKMPAC